MTAYIVEAEDFAVPPADGAERPRAEPHAGRRTVRQARRKCDLAFLTVTPVIPAAALDLCGKKLAVHRHDSVDGSAATPWVARPAMGVNGQEQTHKQQENHKAPTPEICHSC